MTDREIGHGLSAREADQKATRARLQQETLDVLSIQVREKAARSMAEKERESMVVARERDDIARSEKADAKRRSEMKSRNAAYAAELGQQMAIQVKKCVSLVSAGHTAQITSRSFSHPNLHAHSPSRRSGRSLSRISCRRRNGR